MSNDSKKNDEFELPEDFKLPKEEDLPEGIISDDLTLKKQKPAEISRIRDQADSSFETHEEFIDNSPADKEESFNKILDADLRDSKTDLNEVASPVNDNTVRDNFSTAHLIETALQENNALPNQHINGVNQMNYATDNSFKLSSVINFVLIIISLTASAAALFFSLDLKKSDKESIIQTHETKILENNQNIINLQNKIIILENELNDLKASISNSKESTPKIKPSSKKIKKDKFNTERIKKATKTKKKVPKTGQKKRF